MKIRESKYHQNSAKLARCGALIWKKFSTNCDGYLVERFLKGRENNHLLKSLFKLSVIFMTLTASGCTLAVPDAGVDGSSDRLIGAFITSEYLELYDMEGYLNDHASSIMNNSSIIVGNDSCYEGKLVATVDKEGAQSSSEWKISFGNIKGEYVIMPVTADENGESVVGNLCSDGVGEPYLDYTVTDEGEERVISVTIYQQTSKEQKTYYVNPVYQTENGDIYAITGNGYANGTPSEEGNTMAATITAESREVENGKAKKDTCKVSVQFANMYKPVKTVIYQMDETNQVLKQTLCNLSEVPDTLKVEPEAAYILEEIQKEDLSGKIVRDRKILNLKGRDDEETQYLETWSPLDNGLISKKDVEILY